MRWLGQNPGSSVGGVRRECHIPRPVSDRKLHLTVDDAAATCERFRSHSAAFADAVPVHAVNQDAVGAQVLQEKSPCPKSMRNS